MIEGIIGKKVGMTHVYSDDGAMVPVTVIKTGNTVVQRKTKGKDGYEAVQVGFMEKKESRVNKAMKGHFKKAGSTPFYRLVELKGTELDAYQPGAAINAADVFKAGDWVDVIGKSKGKGFMGSMRRHNFSGGSESHGSMHNRAPGSIGSSSDPSRVYKGMKMAGHMGAAEVTVQNLRIVGVRAEENILLVKGAVPGAVNSVVVIKKALKK
ncbi:MAG TPA: 50S ribosomal protein L3 [Deltaproteobacteria bacterium]|nr:MAG: 50S ribosomal protein L3 [Deltaproteobacteria bacterium GWA2_55_82]OGQ65180.1 MAG: 50S ribosomal protein L3 [Deltaproteobacteria bacterium RIFCSPLOWO2_02_FULL_55_12]OIJ74694.1 MAG: 50S ribosomal protein L3 [Deltaproteobacteria bacterium GWC2_55_46]HBG45615.1 50S ribosomal protein L3 [Deltaproteobacteria bacterium]HCY12192.1 50S ribosomal protein L3 [Deltaproteobacteria bacterium]